MTALEMLELETIAEQESEGTYQISVEEVKDLMAHGDDDIRDAHELRTVNIY
jgi:hypothetical protein